MINNRQNGRRRGRGGGPRTPNMMGGGNRPDNRSRGNASQLHEKYKTLARDAQMSGDRVQTEYYHQFADHYYRVLNEMRSRYEDQRPTRGDQRDDQYDDDEDQQDEGQSQESRDEEERRPQRRERPARQDGERDDQGDAPEVRKSRARGDQPRNDQPRNDQPRNDEPREPREARPRRARSPRRDEGERGEEGQRGEEGERIAFDVLPPSIGVSAEVEGDAPKPRRRARRKPGEGEEIAPAA